ncbi:MAG: saccharopine dehydrogenase NADP-binding domain-containing protein, partial [Phaeodactylibacter sp.]|nr:saccharopine dehydrogenase NADP-binding domain-containing protein [Phaeodactylibacter sp.]
MKFLLYGAYGYTGKIIAEYAAQYGLSPILAGRNAEKLKSLAQATGYEYKVLDLADGAALEAALSEVPLVLHAAGPFIHTAQPMFRACLATKTHYLDITGEPGVFEALKKQDKQAKAADILVLPGAGFDVVPTDCLAKALEQILPAATDLKLAFWTIGGGLSHGTAMTMLENLGKGSWVRRKGHLRPVPLGHKTLWLNHAGKRRLAMTIPWGDLSTAYTSTGIPNIETYMGVHPKQYKNTRYLKYINWILRMDWVRQLAQRRVDRA